MQIIINIDEYGRISGQLTQDYAPIPVPTPAPQPSPQPAPQPQPAPTPAPGGTQQMIIGGTNNHVSGTDGQVVVFPIPANWPDGQPCLGAGVNFATDPGRNPIGTEYEVCFSPTPGDFSYPDPLAHYLNGPTFNAYWNREGPNPYAVYIPPGEQWYMNWRALKVPAGQVAGQTFYVPRG